MHIKAPKFGRNIKNLSRNENKFIIKKIDSTIAKTKKLDRLQARLVKKAGSEDQQIQLKK